MPDDSQAVATKFWFAASTEEFPPVPCFRLVRMSTAIGFSPVVTTVLHWSIARCPGLA